MSRAPAIRSITYAAMVGFALAAIGIFWILCESKTTELGTAEGNVLAIVVGSEILCTLGWLVLWRRSHTQWRYHHEGEQEKRKLDTAFRYMSQGLVMFDGSDRMVLCNPRYIELYGASPAIVKPGLSFRELLIHRKATGSFLGDVDERCRALAASLAEGSTNSLVTETRNGHFIKIVNVPLESGGWLSMHEDVTEQRLAERERDRNRSFLDLIIDNVPSAIFVKNADDRKYVLTNRAGERLWGVSREMMIGKTAEAVFPALEASNIHTRDDDLLQSGNALRDEREIQTPDERMHSIFSRRLIVRDENGTARYLLGVVDDVTERKAAEARIIRLAHYDSLTNLPNRTQFRERLEEELLYVRRGGQLAVFYLDLDNFKNINDTLGHPIGDELLKQVAIRLRGCLREQDLIARLGGDEFAIVQTRLCEQTGTEILAQRMREAVAGAVYNLNGHLVTTNLSIGIALAPSDGTEIDELIKNADLALYGAKAEGRATYRYYEPEMNLRIKRRRELEIDLRTAILGGQFVLHYQPVVKLQTGAVTGCEALLRWNHPQRGMIQPLEFIPVAEETELINAIGEWVIRQACCEAMKWPSHISVAVNVSPVQFRHSTLALTVAAALAESGLSANRLELEITESVLTRNNLATVATLHQMRDVGVRISMDDFGTAYSSLNYLRSFPFDKLKIDRSFIDDLATGNEAGAIVRAILDLARTLKMTTTAEGVETINQERTLLAAGCDEAQGFLFSRALPASEISEFLNSPKRSTLKRSTFVA